MLLDESKRSPATAPQLGNVTSRTRSIIEVLEYMYRPRKVGRSHFTLEKATLQHKFKTEKHNINKQHDTWTYKTKTIKMEHLNGVKQIEKVLESIDDNVKPRSSNNNTDIDDFSYDFRLVDYDDDDDDVEGNRIDGEKAKLIQEIVEQKTQRLLHSDEYIAMTAKASSSRRNRGGATNRNQIELWTHDQIQVGKLISSGGFSDVYYARVTSTDISTPIVIKTIRKDLVADEVRFALAAIDLVKDALMMTVLDNAYTLKTVGISALGVQAIEKSGGRPDSFFFAVPLVDTTLEERLQHRGRITDLSKPIPIPCVQNVVEQVVTNTKSDILTRLSLALQLADAVKYLHSLNIIHRDLKPANVGLLSDNSKIQLFDFGRACTLPFGPDNNHNEETYKLTAKAGSTRYVSPENWLGLPYNLKSDVYSFALILHYMVTLDRPYEDMNTHNQEFYVFRRCVRPSLDKSAIQSIPGLAELLNTAWSQDPRDRPTMMSIYKQLDDIISD
jgi:Protein tyrosine and serine/threonine kinase